MFSKTQQSKPNSSTTQASTESDSRNTGQQATVRRNAEKNLIVSNFSEQPDRRAIDRRSSERKYFNTPVQFVTQKSDSCEGYLSDISLNGLRVVTDTPPAEGTDVILFVDRVGRFEARVVRTESAGFAVTMSFGEAKGHRLRQAIQRFLHEEATGKLISDRRGSNTSDRRADRRFQADSIDIIGNRKDGAQFICSIVNLSLSGVEFKTEAELIMGETVSIGKITGQITRATTSGYALKTDQKIFNPTSVPTC